MLYYHNSELRTSRVVFNPVSVVVMLLFSKHTSKYDGEGYFLLVFWYIGCVSILQEQLFNFQMLH